MNRFPDNAVERLRALGCRERDDSDVVMLRGPLDIDKLKPAMTASFRL